VTPDDDLLAEIARLRAQVEAVRALHSGYTVASGTGTYIVKCRSCQMWVPCSTIAALGEEEG
jgi:hypothetical protein